MSNDTVVSLVAPARVSDPLTEVLRSGARRLIEAAVTAEFVDYLSGFVQEKLPDGRRPNLGTESSLSIPQHGAPPTSKSSANLTPHSN